MPARKIKNRLTIIKVQIYNKFKRGAKMILEGKVVKGLGKAKKFINMMNEVFYKKTNIHLYPGTLNIKLENNYNLSVDYLIRPEEYGGTFNVQIQKCELLGEVAYIVRSEKNTKVDGDYNQDIIEIISDVNFRKKYNLKDGQQVEIRLNVNN